MSDSREDQVPDTSVKLLDILREAQKRASQIEAAKTPEQRAREVAERAQRKHEREQLKLAKERARLVKLYEKWSRFEKWKLRDEAVPLLFGHEPGFWNGATLLDDTSHQDDVWNLAKRSVGVSLHVINQNKSPAAWQIEPNKFIAWLHQKGIAVPAELDAALNRPGAVLERANNAKQDQIRSRKDRLKRFINNINQLIESGELTWDKDRIHVTKKDFQEVFYLANPDLKKFSEHTLAADLRDFGVTFKEGTKPTRNNDLKQLFDKGKLG